MKKKWAICGLGRIAERFFAVANDIEDIQITALASSDQDRATQWAKQHNIQAKVYTYDELSTATDIDAIYVATNNHLHYPIVCQLLQNKKAILCEKPFALNDQQSAEMIALAQNNSVLLMEAMWTKFLPTSLQVRDLLQKKTYGEIKSVKSHFFIDVLDEPTHRVFDKTVGGGVLLDLGVYPLSYLYAIQGGHNGLHTLQDIQASATLQNGVDINTQMTLAYDTFTANLQVASDQRSRSSNFTIECQNATISIDNFNGAKTYDLIQNGKTQTIDVGDTKDGFYYEVAHFVDLLSQNAKQSPIQSLQDSQNIMQLMTQIGKQIGLPYHQS